MKQRPHGSEFSIPPRKESRTASPISGKASQRAARVNSSKTEKHGLDTTVVMRLLTASPHEQALVALRFVQQQQAKGEPAQVSDRVIAEAYFALQHHYGISKIEAQTQLLNFLESGAVSEEGGGMAKKALQSSLASPNKPGFIDRLIHAQYFNASRRLVTFEKASKRLAGTLLLK